jgi:hypothetical protein
MTPLDRQQIADLEGQLATLATRFTAADSDQDREKIAERYSEVTDALFAIPSWWGEPAPDSQLPEEWMPASYRQFWAQPPESIEARLANYRKSEQVSQYLDSEQDEGEKPLTLLECRLAALASEFRACESIEDRRKVADRYTVVYRLLEQTDSWVGEPYLDSQLPDEWMPAPSRKSSSVLQTPQGIRKKADDDKPVVSPVNALKNLQRVYGAQQTDLLADAEAFAKKAGGVSQAHLLLDSLLHNQSTTELR